MRKKVLQQIHKKKIYTKYTNIYAKINTNIYIFDCSAKKAAFKNVPILTGKHLS